MKKIKNFLDTKKILFVAFFVIFSFLPLLKIHAAAYLGVSVTAPGNNTTTTLQTLDFSAVFTVPELTNADILDLAADKNYDVYFQPICDGVFPSFGGIYVVSQMDKLNAVPGSTFSRTWRFDSANCPQTTKVLGFQLYEVSNTQKNVHTYATQNITYATGADAGYYYVYQYYSTGDTYYTFGVSAKFGDAASCTTNSTSFMAQHANSNYSIYTACAYAYAPPDLTTAQYQNKAVPVAITPGGGTTPGGSEYTPLAPLPGMEKKENISSFGNYANLIVKLMIGICGALAVIMLIIGGVMYMGDESVFGKTQAKEQMSRAILGLLIALGAWVLLNTINPDLLKVNVAIKAVSAAIINLPDAGDSTVDPNFAKGTGTYTVGTVSPAVASAVTKLKQGWTISQLRVSSTNNTMTIVLKNGSQEDTSSVISIGHGGSGYASAGQGVVGDRKTPIGTWTIISMTTPGNGAPVYNKTGSNMGASFWLLSATVSGERGIGIHGNQSGTITATAGCIRLTNADILALLPYVSTGLQVVVT
jgi:lipoprotein-anchoring transpeptidase ErfK/SrfK